MTRRKPSLQGPFQGVKHPVPRIIAGSLVASLAILAIVLFATSGGVEFHMFGADNTAKADGATATSADGVKCPGDMPVPDPRPAKGTPVKVSALCFVKGDVEVSDSEKGTYTSAHLSDSQGNLLLCIDGCWIRADYGANVTDRLPDDLIKEMMVKDCGSGCKLVHLWIFQGGKLKQLKDGLASEFAIVANANPSPTTAPKADDTKAAPNTCSHSIPNGGTWEVKPGCVIEGDVAVGVSDKGPWLKLYDNVQETGLVVAVDGTASVFVKAPYGASVSGVSVADAFDDVFSLGCGLDNGCWGGVNTVHVKVDNGQLSKTETGPKKTN